MNKLNKLLRRLEPWQILAVGGATFLALLTLVAFGLGPLVFTLLQFAGPAWASIASLVVSIGGVILVGIQVPKVFLLAFYQARFDRELERVVLAFAEARKNG
jgi:hypothetical protein